MDDVAISVQGLSKHYRVFDSQRSRLLHALRSGHRAGMQEIWALLDVDFEVRRGEAVAVIGRNGGGKSTLLQILTGTLEPTHGQVRVNGRVSALLELGSGFNPEFTGRDNVILNGLLLGLDRREILARFDEIVAFADIGDALDRPVKTYSSGMMMRLAFAVQVLTEPEILIIDEALSVGDFFFQQKCFGYIRSLLEKGVTLLFVSHDMGTVRDLCQRAILLRQGRAVFIGDSNAAIHHFLAESTSDGPPSGDSSEPDDAASAATVARDLPQAPFWQRPDGRGPGPLLAVEIVGPDGRPATRARMGDTVMVRTYFRALPADAGHVSLVIKNRYDQVVTSVSSYTCGLSPLTSGLSGFAVFQLRVELMLEAGQYSLMVAFGRSVGKNSGEVLDETGWIGPFQIHWDYEQDRAPFLGMFGLPVRGELHPGEHESGPPADALKGLS